MVKVIMKVALPDRPLDPHKDGAFLCYSDTSPIPWEKKIFVISGNEKQNWFCHEFSGSLIEAKLKEVGTEIYADYPPNIKRTSPIIINIVAARASDLEELKNILQKINFEN